MSKVSYWKYLFGRKYTNGYGSATTAMEVAAANKEYIDGKVAIVTGCNCGIGKETVKALSSAGCKVVMACRDLTKCQAAADDIKKEIPDAELYVHECNLASFKSTRQFVADFEELKLPLHVLVNNAGVMACPKLQTQDGLELQIGTNHFGHFLLTELLTPKLIESAPSRVVNVSSEAHRFTYSGGIRLDDINSETSYNLFKAYGQSKLANVLHARELNRRFSEQKVDVCANSLHPGAIKTELGRYHPTMSKLIGPFAAVFGKSIPQGAATSVFVASDGSINQGNSGVYWADCNLGGESLPKNVDELSAGLWKMSEEITNDKSEETVVP